VIQIGEIRDRDTMSAAIAYAQSGHLCVATLHASNTHRALSRILSFYPAEVRSTLLGDLAGAMRAIVAQRLLRTPGGHRVPTVEVMLNTALISEMIETGDFAAVKEAMAQSMAEGSQTFEEDIARLIGEDVVTREEGLSNADSPTNLIWRLQNRHAPAPPVEDEPGSSKFDDEPSFTDITLDVRF
jgi:twitching motility protein PilU